MLSSCYEGCALARTTAEPNLGKIKYIRTRGTAYSYAPMRFIGAGLQKYVPGVFNLHEHQVFPRFTLGIRKRRLRQPTHNREPLYPRRKQGGSYYTKIIVRLVCSDWPFYPTEL